VLGDEDTNSIFTKKNHPTMGLLTPKNSKADKKANKLKNSGQESKFIKQNSKPAGMSKKPVKTGGSRGS